ERPAQRRDVLVAPLGDLVDLQPLALRQRRHEYTLDELARLPVLLAVGDEIILEFHLAPLAAAPQRDPRAKRDQRRRRVTDRRAVGDVAADRTHIAHLRA